MRKCGLLCGTTVYMKDDIDTVDQAKHNALFSIVRFLNETTKSKAILNRDKSWYNNKQYGIDLPVDLSVVGLKVIDKRVLLSGETCPLSILFHCNLVVDSIHYCTPNKLFSNVFYLINWTSLKR